MYRITENNPQECLSFARRGLLTASSAERGNSKSRQLSVAGVEGSLLSSLQAASKC